LNIVLFGFMGVGKTVVGQELASLLGLEFIDLDDIIVEKAGKPITRIFEEAGESAFRELERKTTKQVASMDGRVIACGGGTVLDQVNLNNLKENSVMIMLTADPETILERTTRDGGVRPLLDVEDKTGRIRELLNQRYPGYLKAADIVVDASEGSPEEIALEILEALEVT
jgi:shikimate kinase